MPEHHAGRVVRYVMMNLNALPKKGDEPKLGEVADMLGFEFKQPGPHNTQGKEFTCRSESCEWPRGVEGIKPRASQPRFDLRLQALSYLAV